MPKKRQIPILEQLGLPIDLPRLIRTGRLHAEIEAARQQWLHLSHKLDLFEQQYPEWCQELPWYSEREAWKAAGRPEPEWWELLRDFRMQDYFDNLLEWPSKWQTKPKVRDSVRDARMRHYRKEQTALGRTFDKPPKQFKRG